MENGKLTDRFRNLLEFQSTLNYERRISQVQK